MSVNIESVTVAYGQTVAVDDVTLSVETAEVRAIVGPSGSGKSTLLRAIAGLEPLASGRIVVGDRDLSTVAPHKRGIGLMFQDHVLFTHRSVAANIAYGLEAAGWSRSDQQSRVDELLDLVGLVGFGNRAVDQLSGGESQRVALARALAPRPSVLLLDEPLGSLDRLLRDQLVGDLDRLLREVGQTALYVTHDQSEAFALADTITVMSQGRVLQTGRPANLWNSPNSRFVARFLGHPNVWTMPTAPQHSVAQQLVSTHPGSPSVLVPVTALKAATMDDDTAELRRNFGGPILGVVRSCRFNQGVYNLVIDSVEPDGEGLSVMWAQSEVPFDANTNVQVFVDTDASVALLS